MLVQFDLKEPQVVGPAFETLWEFASADGVPASGMEFSLGSTMRLTRIQSGVSSNCDPTGIRLLGIGSRLHSYKEP